MQCLLPPAAPTASVTVQPTCAVPTGTIVVTAPTGAAFEYSLMVVPSRLPQHLPV